MKWWSMITPRPNHLFPIMLQLFSKKVRGHLQDVYLISPPSPQKRIYSCNKNRFVFHNLCIVLEEVESKVEMFRNQLRSRLSILPIPLKDMRRYIKYACYASFVKPIVK